MQSGLIPVFLILPFALPVNAGKAAVLGGIVITALVVSFIGMSMPKREVKEPEDLLAIPPEKSWFFPRFISLNKIPDNGLRVSL